MKHYEKKKNHDGKKLWAQQLVLNKTEIVG